MIDDKYNTQTSFILNDLISDTKKHGRSETRGIYVYSNREEVIKAVDVLIEDGWARLPSPADILFYKDVQLLATEHLIRLVELGKIP